MATKTAIKRGTVTPHLVERYQEIFGRDGFLREYNIERDEQIDLLGLSLVAGLDPLFLGEPGVGKTWMIQLMLRTIVTNGTGNSRLFNTLVFKETPADDVLGPRGTHRIEASLDDAILLKRPQTLR